MSVGRSDRIDCSLGDIGFEPIIGADVRAVEPHPPPGPYLAGDRVQGTGLRRGVINKIDVLVAHLFVVDVDILEHDAGRGREGAGGRGRRTLRDLEEIDGETGFFPGLADRGFVWELVAHDVPAGREPQLEARMFVEDCRSIVDDVRGRGEVPRRFHARRIRAALLSLAKPAIETLTRANRVPAHMSEPEVDEDAVRHVAELARVDLSDEEVARFQSEFEEILDYFDRLDDVPDVEVRDDRVNVLRRDDARSSLSQEEALDNADETEDGHFKGPSVS